MANLAVVIHFTALIGFIGHAAFIPLFLWLEVLPMVAFNLASCIIFLFCFWLNRRGHSHTALLVGSAEIVTHAILAVIYTGWDSGFHYYILGLLPLIFYSDQWRISLKVALSGLLGGIYLCLYFYAEVNPPLSIIDLPRASVMGALNIVTIFVVLIALAITYRLAATLAETALQQVNRRLEVQALTDPLTHLSNRRNMQDFLEAASQAYRIYGIPYSVILGDIDNFKAFNDHYGHEAGDLVLVQVARTMRQALREQDQVARWGGEEFLVLVAGGKAKDACQVAERLRASVAAMTLDIASHQLKITMTLGVAEYKGDANLNLCITQADDAMYVGKEHGKNCVSLSKAPEEQG